ncbi:MAG: rhomboid family intramembrane serine protease [Cyanobacteria bacterium J06649_5]
MVQGRDIDSIFCAMDAAACHLRGYPPEVPMISRKLQSLLLALVLAFVLGSLLLALYTADSAWQEKARVLRNGVMVSWALSGLNIISNKSLSRLLGIRPRRLAGLVGIVFSPFLHRDFAHLIANTVPFLVLGWLVLLQTNFHSSLQGTASLEEAASGFDGGFSSGTFYAVTVMIALVGGLGTWLLGRRAIHIGASGLIFGYIGFLLVSGYARQTLLTLGFAAIALVLYGPQLRGMLPGRKAKTTSWEGHLFGFAGGVVAGLQPEFLASAISALSQLVQ